MSAIVLCLLITLLLVIRVPVAFAPQSMARVVAEVFSSMPRRNALSEWNIRPNSSLMKSVVALFGSMSPGRPSFE